MLVHAFRGVDDVDESLRPGTDSEKGSSDSISSSLNVSTVAVAILAIAASRPSLRFVLLAVSRSRRMDVAAGLLMLASSQRGT